MKLPTRDGEFDLTDDMIAALAIRFPAVDAREQCLLAYWWLMRCPARRPVNMPRFIENWIKKAKPKSAKPRLVSNQMSERDIDELGRKLNIPARAGENYPSYLRRLLAAQERSA
jgi:hypothetical protein